MADSFFITKDYDGAVLKTVLKRRWWIPILCIVTCFFGAFIYLRYTKPVYQSSILIQLEDKDNAKKLLDLENINSDASDLNSDVELLRSQLLFERALESMGVNISFYHKGNILTDEKYLSSVFNVQPFHLFDSSLVNVPVYVKFEGNGVQLAYSVGNKNYMTQGKLREHIKNQHFDIVVNMLDKESLLQNAFDDELYFTFNSVETLSSRLLSNLNVQIVDPTAKTINISFIAYNARFSKDLVDALTESFFKYDMEEQRQSSDNVLRFIDNQLDSLSQELKNSKDSLMIFQRKVQLSDPDQYGVELTSDANRYQEQLFLIEEELTGLNDVNKRLSREPNRLEVYRLLPELLGKSYESALLKQIEDLHNLLEKKENLLFSVTEENPEIKSLNSKINFRTASIRKSVDALRSRLLGNAKTIRDKIGVLDGQLFAMPEKKMEFGRLKGIQELNDKYYNLLMEKKVMYAISDAGYSSSNRILKRAEVNLNPVKPNSTQIYSAFLGFGLLLGLIFLFLSYVRFNEISYAEDLKKLLPKSVFHLGSIPLLTREMHFSELLAHGDSNSIVSESLRNIRTNLNFVHPKYKLIAISSSVSGEGKTFVAINLAAIIAMSGKKTVLIDLDLRKPKIHYAFDDANVSGMSNALINEISWQECIRHSEIENLHYITSGPIPPNPSELMLGKKLEDIIAELKETYDVILVDNPPVGIISDGVHLMSIADIPIYVFKSQYSKRNFVERVEELIDVQQIKNLSVVLNGEVSNKQRYGYGYKYSSEKYFDSEPEKKNIISRIFGKWIS